MRLPFRILNVFSVAGDPFSGNPLCVFPEAEGLSLSVMQAFARQTNLSETTFVLPPEAVDTDARVRIFTPSYEMPFAGHPTLGTAHVVAAGRSRVALGLNAGRVEVTLAGDRAELRAAVLPKVSRPQASAAEIAGMVGLDASALDGEPAWVNTGVEQLVVPVRSSEHVRAAVPVADSLLRYGKNSLGEGMAYLVAREGDGYLVRFFFTQLGAVVEDPATGSACANLGGYLAVVRGERGITTRLRQGEAILRPSELGLRVDDEGRSYVSGRVTVAGEGSFVWG